MQTHYQLPDRQYNNTVHEYTADTRLLPYYDVRQWNGSAAPAIASETDIADALLKRDMSAVTGESARSPLNALRLLRNKWVVATGTLSVKKEDDSTEAWSSAVSSDAAADPITGSDPA